MDLIGADLKKFLVQQDRRNDYAPVKKRQPRKALAQEIQSEEDKLEPWRRRRLFKAKNLYEIISAEELAATLNPPKILG